MTRVERWLTVAAICWCAWHFTHTVCPRCGGVNVRNPEYVGGLPYRSWRWQRPVEIYTNNGVVYIRPVE